MCDADTDADNARISRRDFALGASAASMAALLPSPANARPVTGRAVTIETPDGPAQAFYAAPASGRHPAILVWPDIMGLRPAFEGMATRLAESGYAVLAVNQFHRSTKTPFTALPDARAKAMEWRKAITPEATTRDALAFMRWLDGQKEVDAKRAVGSTGYCMGGPMTFLTAVARPDRVRGIASFHGAGLATDSPDSPHRLVPRMKARALIAVAQNDDARAPTDKDKVRAAFAAAKRPAEVEVYPANHGWCPPDSPAYDRAQAERAWDRQLVLLKTL
ncbi:dienelactone hydrolase [Sphingomonas sp. Leaf412]|uniref:dienelactone hydrolase family protein n=1 Tax=Sphingomonas sp. Leaf412 TaxID=1736370 RepID=UPI0006FE6408|nr:dienelactone hydrolase family protein [Sphingomonas sp. Leaf412]KQT34648.1 dienelactone hydrolase [Sphingomonas sp. Leaf412]